MNDIKKIYNKIAEDYYNLRTNENPRGWFYNELLEMPATLKLLGNVKNKRILDLGCGAGIYAKILAKKGAKVKGIDISEEQIKIAKRENPKIEFRAGNAEKLPYKNKEFDIVLTALVLEHLKEWDKILAEIRRVLKKNGMFVFSIGNPVTNCIRVNNRRRISIKREYFREIRAKSRWGEKGVCMIWYHKTYGTIVRSLVRNGFDLVDYEDAKPINKSKKLFPKYYEETNILPYFCTWKWRKK